MENFRYQELMSESRRDPYFRSHPISSDRIAALELDLEAARETLAREQETARTAAEQRSYAETRLRQQEQQVAARTQDNERLRTDLDAARSAVSQAARAEETQRQAMAAATTELATERQARTDLLAQVDSITRLLVGHLLFQLRDGAVEVAAGGALGLE